MINTQLKKGYKNMKNMKKLVLATALATVASAATAEIMINGKYKGKISEDTSGSYKYVNDLDLTIKGKFGDTVMVSTFENIGKTGDDNKDVLVKQIYIESAMGDVLNFKGGTYKSKNGKGLLQENTTKTRMKVSTELGGISASIMQVSGESDQQLSLSTKVGGTTFTVQNVTDDTRFFTLQGDLGGISLLVEAQEASPGNTNIGVQAGITAGALDLTGVYIDVQDTAGVFQYDGIIGKIADANSGSTVTGFVASTKTDFGKVTGKYITKNDLNTVVGKLNVGIWEFGASKTENDDAVFDASIKIKF